MNILNNVSFVWNLLRNPIEGFFDGAYFVWDFLWAPTTISVNTNKIFIGEFPLEIISLMLSYIESDKDKCQFLMTCHDITKCDFTFNEEVRINKIAKSRWYDRFTKVGIYYGDKWPSQFPLSIKHLIYLPLLDLDHNYHYNGPVCKIDSIDNPQMILPLSIIKLTINDFDNPVIGLDILRKIISIDTEYIYTNTERGILFDSFAWKTPIPIVHAIMGKEINLNISHIDTTKSFGLTKVLLLSQIEKMNQKMNMFIDDINKTD